MFYPLKDPPQFLLDGLLTQETSNKKPCHDCGVMPGNQHIWGCDVARCTVCGLQYFSCGCGQGTMDIWTGIWPGI